MSSRFPAFAASSAAGSKFATGSHPSHEEFPRFPRLQFLIVHQPICDKNKVGLHEQAVIITLIDNVEEPEVLCDQEVQTLCDIEGIDLDYDAADMVPDAFATARNRQFKSIDIQLWEIRFKLVASLKKIIETQGGGRLELFLAVLLNKIGMGDLLAAIRCLAQAARAALVRDRGRNEEVIHSGVVPANSVVMLHRRLKQDAAAIREYSSQLMRLLLDTEIDNRAYGHPRFVQESKRVCLGGKANHDCLDDRAAGLRSLGKAAPP